MSLLMLLTKSMLNVNSLNRAYADRLRRRVHLRPWQQSRQLMTTTYDKTVNHPASSVRCPQTPVALRSPDIISARSNIQPASGEQIYCAVRQVYATSSWLLYV